MSKPVMNTRTEGIKQKVQYMMTEVLRDYEIEIERFRNENKELRKQNTIMKATINETGN